MTLTAVIHSEGPALYVGVILYYNEPVCSFAYIIINEINKSRFWLSCLGSLVLLLPKL
jgi:hypothetical protein